MDSEELANNQCNTFTALEIFIHYFLTMTMEQTRKMTFARNWLLLLTIQR